MAYDKGGGGCADTIHCAEIGESWSPWELSFETLRAERSRDILIFLVNALHDDDEQLSPLTRCSWLENRPHAPCVQLYGNGASKVLILK